MAEAGRNPSDSAKSKWTRRRFLKYAVGSTAGIAAAGLTYSAIEAGWIDVTTQAVTVPNLPPAFAGLRAAFLTDIHHGPFTSLSYVNALVAKTNALAPDVILLGGDYVHRDRKYIAPCQQSLAALSAPLGVFGVLGNHDHWESERETRAAIKTAGIVELTNTGVWLKRGGQRLRLGGVGDLWEDVQDIDAALGEATASDASIVLSHNPDVAEKLTDPRVGLMLSGHTHGGQVVLPVIGAPIVPSRYGQKYVRGLVKAPATQVFVSRGLGTITPPLRFCCRPEITVITLQ